MSQRVCDEAQYLLYYEVVEIHPAHKEHMLPQLQEHISSHIFLVIIAYILIKLLIKQSLLSFQASYDELLQSEAK